MNSGFQRLIVQLRQNDPTVTEVSLGFWDTLTEDSKISVLARSISNNIYLTKLDLSWCVIEADKAQVLATELKSNSGLQELNLYNANIEIISLLAIVNALMMHPAIKKIRLGSISGYRLTHQLDRHRNFILHNALDFCVEIIDLYSKQFDLLNEDNVISNSLSLGLTLYLLLSYNKIEVLDLSHAKLIDIDVAYLSIGIAISEKLKELNLESSKLSPSQFSMLASGLRLNQSLERINLEFCGLNDECLSDILTVLSDNTSLQILRIGHNELSSAAHNSIRKNFIHNHFLRFQKNVQQHFSFDECGQLTKQSVEAIKNLISDYKDGIKYSKINFTSIYSKQFISLIDHLQLGKSLEDAMVIVESFSSQWRPLAAHLYGLYLMVRGIIFTAWPLLIKSWLTDKQRLNLVNSILVCSDLPENDRKYLERQLNQLALVILRDIRYCDRADDITLRRLICALNNSETYASIPSLKSLTGADIIITLAEFKKALNRLQLLSKDVTFKDLKADFCSEEEFQALIMAIKEQIKLLKGKELTSEEMSPELDKIDQNSFIRCYEMIALHPGIVSSLADKTHQVTAPMQLDRCDVTIETRYSQMSEELLSDMNCYSIDDEAQMEHISKQAIRCIDEYLLLPRTLFSNSHLSIFSILFDSGTGLRRAEKYRDQLGQQNKSPLQRLAALNDLLLEVNGK